MVLSSDSSSSSSCSTELRPLSTVTHKKKTGRKKFKETRHPIYRCVRQRNGNKWVCEVREPNKKNSRIWLGTYSTPEMAARAYDVAALALRGNSASLNFPESAWLLPRPKSAAIKDIQAAAFEAAQAFAHVSIPQSSSSSPSSPSSSSSSSSPSSPSLSSSSSSPSSSTAFLKLQPAKSLNEVPEATRMFWDEEAFFSMPRLLDSMAEGLMLTPPSLQSSFDWNEVDWNTDFLLWGD